MSTLAIDIDSSSIRLLVTRGNRVERWADTAVLPAAVRDGTIADPAAVGTQARELMRMAGISGADVVASVSGLFSASHILTVEPLPKSETLRRVPVLAREALPAEDLRVAWQLLNADETGQEVLVLGVSPAQVDLQVQTLRAAGVRPRILELRAQALARAVRRERALIVSAEPAAVEIVLVTMGVPRVMRTLHRVSPDSAVEADELVQLLERTVDYYNSQRPRLPITPNTPLFLVGSLAEESSLVEKVAERVDYSVEEFLPPLVFPPHFPRLRYAVAIGLALESLAVERKKWWPRRGAVGAATVLPLTINFAPPDTSLLRLTPRRALLLGELVAGLALTLFLYQQVGQAEEHIRQLEGQVSRTERLIQDRLADQTEVVQKEKAIGEIKAITASRGGMGELYDLMHSLAPEGVTLGAMTLDKGTLVVSGAAAQPSQVIDFVTILNGTGKFSVELKSIVTGPQSFSFQIKRL